MTGRVVWLFLVAVFLATTAAPDEAAVLEAFCQGASVAAAIPVVRAGAAREGPPGSQNGFVVRTAKASFIDCWGYEEMNKLLDFGCTGPLCMAPGMPIAGADQGTCICQFVNLHESGNRGAFTEDNGHADQSYPGIDPFESPTSEPAGGDDDSYFATEVLAVIRLHAGLHIIGANSQDGTIIEVGGIEIGRTNREKAPSNADFLFSVEQDGYYTFRARSLAAEGGASLELHEIVRNAEGVWRRVLLGDVAAGGSPVLVPEPLAVTLLGLGALPAIRRRK